MQIIWRFYQDARRQWHWEKIGPGYTVVAVSSKSYKDYEACSANAQKAGYVYQPPQGKHIQAQHPRRY
jgi:hypothetical protein